MSHPPHPRRQPQRPPRRCSAARNVGRGASGWWLVWCAAVASWLLTTTQAGYCAAPKISGYLPWHSSTGATIRRRRTFRRLWEYAADADCQQASVVATSEARPLNRRRRKPPSHLILRSSLSEGEEPQNRLPTTSPLSKKSMKLADEATAAAIIRDRKFLERNQHWIVFVDDEEAIRQSVGDYLYDSGYQVTACADAAAAVEVCQTAPKGAVLPKVPACFVSDIRMPGGPDGLELLQWIRASDTLKRVPVVLLTAKGLTEDRIAGYKAGADVYLPKPFFPEELLSAIDNLIQRRKQMTGSNGSLLDLQQEMANIKLLLKENGQRTVKQTDVYLTPAAREVLDLLCKGYTNAEIAEERGTSKNFVTKTLKKIYLETGTTTRTELLKWAIQTGYVNPKL